MTLIPNSETDAAYIIRNAASDGKKLALCGGNTRAGFGNSAEPAEMMNSTGLSGIVDYEPAETAVRRSPRSRRRLPPTAR
jgi:glycolate oxidase FAD binding subunit